MSGQSFACDTAESEGLPKKCRYMYRQCIVYFGKEANTVTLNDETFLFSVSDVIEKPHTQLHVSVLGR
jgi:hypothetical protein